MPRATTPPARAGTSTWPRACSSARAGTRVTRSADVVAVPGRDDEVAPRAPGRRVLADPARRARAAHHQLVAHAPALVVGHRYAARVHVADQPPALLGSVPQAAGEAHAGRGGRERALLAGAQVAGHE